MVGERGVRGEWRGKEEEKEAVGEVGKRRMMRRKCFSRCLKVMWCSTYPTSVATRFCALLTISNILTVRSDEQVASLLP